MAVRTNLDVELRPLWQALKARIDGLGESSRERRDGGEAYLRDGVAFLQVESRRDHMHLDLWLPAEKLEEARASGIAKAHPFMGDEAVRVRFERAEDLPQVARWLEASFRHAASRAQEEVPDDPEKRLDHR